MAFDTYEKSPDLGQPIRLFEFRFGGLRFFYTDSEDKIEWVGKTWFPVPLRGGALTESASSDKQTVTFDMSAELPFAKQFFRTVAPWNVGVRMYEGHSDDPDQEFILVFEGTLKSAQFRKQTFSASFETLQVQSGAVEGLRKPFSTLCPHTLFDQACKAVKADHSVTTTAVTATDDTLTLPTGWEGTFVKDHFLYGMCEWTGSDGNDHAALIVSVDPATDAIKLSYAPDTIEPGTTELFLSKGCPKTSEACDTRFSNIVNFGGAITAPINTPFGD